MPDGARRVDLAGKTVMPMIVDTHTHLSTTRDALIRDLKQRAYFGVSAAMSIGMDGYALLGLRGETSRCRAVSQCGKGITSIEPGRTTFLMITTEAEGRKAVEEIAAHKADIVKIWVDEGAASREADPWNYGAIIDEAHKRGLRVTAHIFHIEDAKGLIRAGIDAFAHGVRDKDIDDETGGYV